MKTKITTLIGSCDSYSYLWKNFDILYTRYFEPDLDKVLVSETKVFDNKSYKTITPGVMDWGARMLYALNTIETKYVYFLLEDFYFTSTVPTRLIEESLEILESRNADKILIDVVHRSYTVQNLNENNLFKFSNKSMYLNSVSPSIWNVEYFKNVLKPHYNPWQFELEGNKFTSSCNPDILLYKQPTQYFLPLVRKGGKYRTNGWEELFKKEGLVDEK